MTGATTEVSSGSDFRPFDCDNHYYESEDAFIRHVASLLHVDDIRRAQARRRAESRHI